VDAAQFATVDPPAVEGTEACPSAAAVAWAVGAGPFRVALLLERIHRLVETFVVGAWQMDRQSVHYWEEGRVLVRLQMDYWQVAAVVVFVAVPID